MSIVREPDRLALREPRPDDLVQYGPLTTWGEKVYAQIDRAAQDGRLDLGKDDLLLLGSAIETLANFNKLLAVAAAGEPGALDLLRKRFEERPGLQVWRDLDAFTGRRPIGPIYDAPCGVGGIDLGSVIWMDIHLSGGRLSRRASAGRVAAGGWEPTVMERPELRGGLEPARRATPPIFAGGWSERAMTEYGAIAGPIERVLQAGRSWIDTGDIDGLRDAFRGLREIATDGQRDLTFPCFDEQQVCLAEMLNFSWERLRRPSFPPLAAVTPADVCVGYPGLLNVTPATSFPPPDGAGGIFPTIDHQAADVASWTPSSILLRVPAGIAPGCHTVGWGFLMEPEAVNELRAIGEQCLPWFPRNGYKVFPFILWDEPLSFSVIGDSSVAFAVNGVNTVTAEECAPVTLTWSVGLKTCAQTSASLRVSMLKNGQPFRPTLPTDGQLVVADADDATYTLRAESRLGSINCATVERAVTINRQKLLHVAPLLDRCVDAGATVSLNITKGCPAPAGGLPISIASSDTAKVANGSFVLGEGERAALVDLQVGTRCGAVTLTVTAPGYVQAQISFVIVAPPQISAVSPTSIQTCDGVELTLTGSCLGDPGLPPVGTLISPMGELLIAVVEVRTAQTDVRLSHDPLPAGAYTVALSNCGRASMASTPLVVVNRPPQITSRLSANATALQICSTPTLTPRWTVRFASTIRLIRDGTLVIERNYDDVCAPHSDSVSETLPQVTSSVSYQLDAVNPDGAIVSSNLTLQADSAFPIRSAFAVFNSRSEAMNVFLLNVEDLGGLFIGQLAPMQSGQMAPSVSVTIPDCRVRFIASVAPRVVAEHNARFPNNQFDATSVTTARTSGGGDWQGNSSQACLGRPGTGTEVVSV